MTIYRRREGRLRFSESIRRYVLDGWELHCGDAFEVLVDDTWMPTRIEMSGNQWYLVGLPAVTLDGLEARSHSCARCGGHRISYTHGKSL